MRILVFGSLNIDNVFSVDHFVKKGETLLASEVRQYPGGKGLNQAVAAPEPAQTYGWLAISVLTDASWLICSTMPERIRN